MPCSVPWACFCRAWASFMVACAVARSAWIFSMVWCPGCVARFCAVRWLSAWTCRAPFGLVAEVVTAEKTASDCSCERIACSLARAPYCTVTDWSMRAVALARAGPDPASPVYQATVFAVPLTSVVALPNGVPPTRSGGTAAVAVAGRPSAANAGAFELVTDRPAALSVCSEITPPETVDGVEVPVMESIFVNSVCTLSVTLSWLPGKPPGGGGGGGGGVGVGGAWGGRGGR